MTSPEGGASNSAEHRETHLIYGAVIPADDEQDLRWAPLLSDGLRDRQILVGGNIEALDLDEHQGRLYYNEHGQQLELPPNRRATLLTWLYSHEHRYHTIIHGDTILLGPGRGKDDSTLPDRFNRLFEADYVRVDLRLPNATRWYDHPERFSGWYAAANHGLKWAYSIAQRAVEDQGDVRIVPL